LKQLQARGLIDTATVPDLGPLPQSSPTSGHSDSGSSDGSESESSSGEDDGGRDDDDDEYNEDDPKPKSDPRPNRVRTRRGTGPKASLGSPSPDGKKETSVGPSEGTPKPEVTKKRKRGRPPKIDTPEEARIRSILRAVRKVRDKDGRQLFLEFERLPDPDQYPDYFKEIKRPIALDHITVLLFW
jgi:chromatin structure-remodeling complex subunit RSC1/2